MAETEQPTSLEILVTSSSIFKYFFELYSPTPVDPWAASQTDLSVLPLYFPVRNPFAKEKYGRLLSP